MRSALACLALLLSLADGVAAEACERSSFTIAVDPGHTNTSPGATSARGVPEVQFNARLASRLVRVLKQAGFDNAFLTNRDGAPIALLDRSRVADDRDARLFLSIHHDSAQPQFFSTWLHRGVRRSYSDAFKGHSIFVSQQNGDAAGSLRFARLLGDRLRTRCFVPTLHHAQKIGGESRELLDADAGGALRSGPDRQPARGNAAAKRAPPEADGRGDRRRDRRLLRRCRAARIDAVAARGLPLTGRSMAVAEAGAGGRVRPSGSQRVPQASTPPGVKPLRSTPGAAR